MTERTPPAGGPWLRCHCCGKSFPAANLVNFHANPGDAICVTCAAWIYGRSKPIARRLYPLWELPARLRSRRQPDPAGGPSAAAVQEQ